MLVIPPLTITPAMLLSSTIAEPDTTVGEVVWVSGTTYALGDQVIVISEHKVYERVVAGAGTVSPQLDLTNWVEIGPTNKWAMFDTFRNTASTSTSVTTVSIAPGQRINAIAIMGAHVSSITVTVVVGADTVYTHTADMISRDVVDYYDYFFDEFSFQQSLLLLDIPPVRLGTVNISFSEGSVSSIVLGTQEYLGYTQRGHTNEALNFSLAERDDFGGVTLVQRRSIPKTTQTIIVAKKDIPTLLRIREQLKASPAVWSGLSNTSEGYFNALLILGIYTSISLTLDLPEYAKCTIDLEEI